MPDVFYPCCEVGDKVPYEQGPLKSNCWNCGNPDFIQVIDMGEGGYGNDFRYYSFTYNARVIRPTGELPRGCI